MCCTSFPSKYMRLFDIQGKFQSQTVAIYSSILYPNCQIHPGICAKLSSILLIFFQFYHVIIYQRYLIHIIFLMLRSGCETSVALLYFCTLSKCESKAMLPKMSHTELCPKQIFEILFRTIRYIRMLQCQIGSQNQPKNVFKTTAS